MKKGYGFKQEHAMRYSTQKYLDSVKAVGRSAASRHHCGIRLRVGLKLLLERPV